jgi:putative chitinase
LNYSAEGLQKIFKKYFPTPELAQQYARQPEKIANRVYSGRMGNGDEASGDGWKFCGRGVIQLTGRFNYTKFAESLEMDIDEAVAYLETPEGAVVSAGWFWDKNKLNAICDRDDFILLTKRINGGTIGLKDRQHHYEIALPVLAG